VDAGPLRAVTRAELDRLHDAAARAERRRTNLDLHASADDPVQRFFNALEPGTYCRPHRHAPDRWELFLLLAGAAGVLVFGDDGRATHRLRLEPPSCTAVEIPGAAWHTLVALAPRTLLFEVKPGPYDPASDKHFAPWAPPEGDVAAAVPLVAAWTAGFALNDPTG